MEWKAKEITGWTTNFARMLPCNGIAVSYVKGIYPHNFYAPNMVRIPQFSTVNYVLLLASQEKCFVYCFMYSSILFWCLLVIAKKAFTKIGLQCALKVVSYGNLPLFSLVSCFIVKSP